MVRGKFISIEGGEGAGKSTALQFIKKYLMHAKIDALWTREPGGTEMGEQIRNLLLHPLSQEAITPQTELLLMFAARDQHLKNCIIPALNAGKWVVSDRFVDASYAYQGGGRGMNMEHIRTLDQWIVQDVYPDLTLLLDIDPVLGFQRTEKRGTEKDRIEQEKMDFFVRVRNVYLARAEQAPQRIKIIDASQELEIVENQIRDVLDKFVHSNK
jgi:dTMP kinase